MNAWILAEAVLNLVAVKFERDAILARIKQMEADGKTAEEMVDELRAMRDAAIRTAEQEIG